VHEYQAKEIFRRHGVPLLRGVLARTPEDVERAFTELGGPVAVVKAQIHAGGRGKAGGVRLVRSAADAHAAATAILAKPLVTPQTGPKGRQATRLWVEEGASVAVELYAGIVVDRSRGSPVLMVSREGGVEIEDVARERPDAILREPIPAGGLPPYRARVLAKRLGLAGKSALSVSDVLVSLARAFLAEDLSLAEVNPLAVLADGRAIALDAKATLDDNALFRHPENAAMRDPEEEDPAETRAQKAGLSYVRLDGSIGCMVNGAGLAMATMDAIRLHGGMPANFLDVGGGASKEQVTEAFKILLDDRNVRAVLVNIFGGIMKCDVIAEGILAALREVALEVPLVVRLEGTRVEEGRDLLRRSGLRLTSATDMTDAAEKAVAAAAGAAA
jgi:succinyl-CoA synthetase beta subunit